MLKESEIFRMVRYISIVFAVLYVFLGTAFAVDKLPVFVTIAPQKYFVQQIGKNLVDVQVMVHPGADPHTYEPKPKQMVAISKAKLYFTVGIEFEEAKLSKIIAANPSIKVIHTDHGFVCGNHQDIKVVYLLELCGFGVRSTGHAGKAQIAPEEPLIGQSCQMFLLAG